MAPCRPDVERCDARVPVEVESAYLPERSAPSRGEYAFNYTVRISNEGALTAQLRSRHWIITDGDGKVQEVRGEGVVGAKPGCARASSSSTPAAACSPRPMARCAAPTRWRPRPASRSTPQIAPFPLALPYSLN